MSPLSLYLVASLNSSSFCLASLLCADRSIAHAIIRNIVTWIYITEVLSNYCYLRTLFFDAYCTCTHAQSVHTCTHMYTHTDTHTHTHKHNICCVFVCVRACVCVRVCTCMYTHTHTHKHTNTHAHIHTCYKFGQWGGLPTRPSKRTKLHDMYWSVCVCVCVCVCACMRACVGGNHLVFCVLGCCPYTKCIGSPML